MNLLRRFWRWLTRYEQNRWKKYVREYIDQAMREGKDVDSIYLDVVGGRSWSAGDGYSFKNCTWDRGDGRGVILEHPEISPPNGNGDV